MIYDHIKPIARTTKQCKSIRKTLNADSEHDLDIMALFKS
jgi:hypothetical protein